MENNKHILAASVLAADFGKLGEQIQIAVDAGIDWFHVDIMDGHYVPTISFGSKMIKEIRKYAPNSKCDAHLMVEKPENIIDEVLDAGADVVSFHPDATRRVHNCISRIHSKGAQAGLALSPGVPLQMIEPMLAQLDLVVIMTVEPGFGGQQMIVEMLAKVQASRSLIDQQECAAKIQVDGGVNTKTASQLVTAGADIFVVGSSLFADNKIQANHDALIACVND